MTQVHAPGRTRAVGIVVPVHDEERLLCSALGALELAADRVAPEIPWHLVVVLDDCRDGSATVAQRWIRHRTRKMRRRSSADRAVTVIAIDAGRVGAARRAGCEFALCSFTGMPAEHIWLATTDADSTVPENWLAVQLTNHNLGVDIWSGSVTVGDWIQRESGTGEAWDERYGSQRHWAHGASLGVNGGIYLGAGGFEGLASGEDRSLLDVAARMGARTKYDRAAPVTTSARRNGRAPLGFAHALSRLEEELGQRQG